MGAPNAPVDLSGAQMLEGVAANLNTVSNNAVQYLGDIQQQEAYNSYLAQRQHQQVADAQAKLVRKVNVDNAKTKYRLAQDQFIRETVANAAQSGLLGKPKETLQAFTDWDKSTRESLRAEFGEDYDAQLQLEDALNEPLVSGMSRIQNEMMTAYTKKTVADADITLNELINRAGTMTTEQGVPFNATLTASYYDDKAKDFQTAIDLDPQFAKRVAEGREKAIIGNLNYNVVNHPELVIKDLENPAVRTELSPSRQAILQKDLKSQARTKIRENVVETEKKHKLAFSNGFSALRIKVANKEAGSSQILQFLEQTRNDPNHRPEDIETVTALYASAKNRETARDEKASVEEKREAVQGAKLANARLLDLININSASTNNFNPKKLKANDLKGFSQFVSKAYVVVNAVDTLVANGYDVPESLIARTQAARAAIAVSKEGGKALFEKAGGFSPEYEALINTKDNIYKELAGAVGAPELAFMGAAYTKKDLKLYSDLVWNIYSSSYMAQASGGAKITPQLRDKLLQEARSGAKYLYKQKKERPSGL
jgi:hypothetical protein